MEADIGENEPSARQPLTIMEKTYGLQTNSLESRYRELESAAHHKRILQMKDSEYSKTKPDDYLGSTAVAQHA